jgi:hypothetical protein
MSREPKWTDKQRQEIMDFRRVIPAKHNEAYRRNYDNALSGKSLKAAIKAHCLDCMGWERAEVRDCTVVSCSLWLYRPYRTKIKKACSINSGAPTIAPVLSGEPNALFAACGTGQEQTE